MTMFSGKVALVTGASSGLGEASAWRFAQEGAKVVIAARRAAQGARVVQRIVDAGGEALFVQADVSRASDVERMVASTLDRFGRLDCAVNNAGIAGPRFTPIADVTEAQWDEVMDVNLKGVWLCMKHEIPALLAGGGGAIVNVASVAGLGGSGSSIAYAASKGALITMTRSLAKSLAPTIRVNAVCPGVIVSRWLDDHPEMIDAAIKITPLKRASTTDDVAGAITFLACDASMMTGQAIVVDGGRTM